jgi:hypothetical protein
MPARAYLSGERGTGWGDAKVEQYLTTKLGGNPVTPVQARGAEIVTALCKTAETDDGTYVEIVDEVSWFGREAVQQKKWVAVAAAEALTVPGKPPTPEVAAAQAAARARSGEGEASPAPVPERAYIPPIHQVGS